MRVDRKRKQEERIRKKKIEILVKIYFKNSHDVNSIFCPINCQYMC